MDLDRIERLLAKYWECETSVEVLSEDAPDKWTSLIPLFQYYKHERDEK